MKRGILLITSLLLLCSMAFADVVIEAAEEVQVVFSYENSDASAVYIAGSFNGWNATGNPMTQNEEGLWVYIMDAKASETIQYKFVLEGEEWITDPGAPATVDDGFSGLNGVVNVKALMMSDGDDEASVSSGGLMFGTYTYMVMDSTILTRDIMSGKIAGYDFDSQKLLAESYWKVSGEAVPGMNIYAELQVMQGEAAFYENGQDANVPPTVNWADGLSNLADLAIRPFNILNGGDPVVGHLKATFTTPYAAFYTGYHYAKGTTHSFMYETVSESDANDGFMEISNGSEFQEFGPVTLNGVVGLNKRSGYGAYNWVTATFDDYTADLSFNIKTDKDELFYFFDQYSSMLALGFGGTFGPVDAKMQWAGNFGVNEAGDTYHMFNDLDQNAITADATYAADMFGLYGFAKWGGDDTTTVYGDTTEAGNFIVGLNPWVQPMDILKVGFDANATFTNGTFEEGSELTVMESGFDTYVKPWVDVTLDDFVPFDMTTSVFGKMNINLISQDDDVLQPVGFKFYQAGLKANLKSLSETISSMSFTYSMSLDYNSYNEGYELNEMYNSLMAEAGLANDLSLTAGMIVRTPMDGMLDVLKDKVCPFGAMVGGSWIIPSEQFMKPVLYANFTYDMDAYDKNALNFNDDDTYLPEDLNGGAGESHFRVGLIWSF